MAKAKNVVALDIGFGQTKVVSGPTPDDESIFPSFTSKVEDNSNVNPKGEKPAGEIKIGGKTYLTGADAVIYGTPRSPVVDSLYIETEDYMALALSAMKRQGITEAEIVTGLPVRNVARLTSLLQAQFESWERFGYKLTIQTIKTADGAKPSVLAQPMGTLFDLIIDDGGVNQDYASGRFGVVDIGDGTIDLIEARDMQTNWDNFDSAPVGMNVGYTFLYHYVKTKKKADGYTLADMRKVMREGAIEIAGKREEIPSAVKEAREMVAMAALEKINSLWGNCSSLNRLILTGGGAEALKPILEKNKDLRRVLHVPENPSMANARGYFKYANYVVPATQAEASGF